MARLRNGHGIGGIDALLRGDPGLRGFAGIVHIKESHGKRTCADRIEGHGGGMDQHGRVDAFKSSSFKQEDLAAGIPNLLGGGPDDLDGQAKIIGHLRRGDTRAGRYGRHEIMPAGMSDFGQGIVLGADSKMERTGACSRAKGGGEITNPCLNLETGTGEDLGDPAAGLLFSKAQLRVVVNAMREIDQGLLIGVDGFLSLLLCVHECFLSHFAIGQQPRSVRRRG